MMLIMTLLVVHLGGFECISHFQKQYSGCLSVINGNFPIFCADTLREILLLVPGSILIRYVRMHCMAKQITCFSWKSFL